jgi:hypothetical protein
MYQQQIVWQFASFFSLPTESSKLLHRGGEICSRNGKGVIVGNNQVVEALKSFFSRAI